MGKSVQALSEKVNLIASSSSWIEGKAIQQLLKTAELPGISQVSGMPDLHPGRGYPVGAAFFSCNKIYPALVGNDIGCGMALWQTTLKKQKASQTKMSSRLRDVEAPLDFRWAVEIQAGKSSRNIQNHAFDSALGTIGGGNHFAEFQLVDTVIDEDAFAQSGLNMQCLQLLVHSGSRGLGQDILQGHVREHGHQGLSDDSVAFQEYMQRHDEALAWAELNRRLIAQRFLSAVRTDGTEVLDVNHNLVSAGTIQGKKGWLHRKGATPADQGLVMIPGSRGDYSYLVQPTPSAVSLFSLAHGAGRKWGRGDCKARLTGKYKKDDLYRTSMGSQVICGDNTLLYDEAPEAYKDCGRVIADLCDAGLIKVVAKLKPYLTFKTQGACS